MLGWGEVRRGEVRGGEGRGGEDDSLLKVNLHYSCVVTTPMSLLKLMSLFSTAYYSNSTYITHVCE